MHFGIPEKPTMTAYRCVVTLASPLKFLKKMLKIAVLYNPVAFDALSPGNLHEHPHKPYVAGN